MNNPFGKKMAEMLGKMDEKVLQAKLTAAIDMLKNGDTEELAKKLGKVNKDELMSKMNEFDPSKISELNINLEEVKQKVDKNELEKLSQLIGERGDEIVKKIKEIMK